MAPRDCELGGGVMCTSISETVGVEGGSSSSVPATAHHFSYMHKKRTGNGTFNVYGCGTLLLYGWFDEDFCGAVWLVHYSFDWAGHTLIP